MKKFVPMHGDVMRPYMQLRRYAQKLCCARKTGHGQLIHGHSLVRLTPNLKYGMYNDATLQGANTPYRTWLT